MKLVLTGGAGFIGTAVLNQLFSTSTFHEVVVLDNFWRGNYSWLVAQEFPVGAEIRVVEGDILDGRLLREIFHGADVVCHLAAATPRLGRADGFQKYDQVNHWGTAQIVEATLEKNVGRFVYLSSTAIYGESRSSGDSTFEQRSPYGESKARAERQVERLRGRIQTSIIRSAQVFGINRSARFETIPNSYFLDLALKRPIRTWGSAKQSASIIDIETLARIVTAACEGLTDEWAFDAIEHVIEIAELLDIIRKISPSAEVNAASGSHYPFAAPRSEPSLIASQFCAGRTLEQQVKESLDRLMTPGQ